MKLCSTGGKRVAGERVVVAAEEHCSFAAPVAALLVSELCYFLTNASGRSGVPSSRLTIGRPVEGETELHEGLCSAGYEGYVDALRRATIALAAEISGQLVAK